MSINPLNAISKVYLDQVSCVETEKQIAREALDPVGKEDSDIDNDGAKNTKTDKYLLNRRKVRGAAIAKKKSVKEGYSNWREELSEVAEIISKEKNDQKITEKKINNKIKINPTIDVGDRLSGSMRESVDNLGGTLIEMVEIDEVDYIVESVYGELLNEGYEEDDIEEAIEYALIEATVTYGHDTDKPYAHKKKTGAGRLIKAVGRLARQKLASKVSGAKSAARKAVSSGARKVASAATKIADRADSAEKHTKRNTAKGHEEIMRNNREYQTAGKSSGGYRNVGVGRKEKVSSGSYTPPTKRKVETPADPWKGSATVPPKSKDKKEPEKPKAKPAAPAPAAAKPKAKPAAPAAAKPKVTAKTTKAKKKRTSKLDDLLADIRKEDFQLDEKTLTSAETKKKEELVKSMKKRMDDFEARYPGRGKEVMYATATKMAKKISEQAMELQPKEQKPSSSKSQEAKIKSASQKAKQAEISILQKKLQAIRSTPAGTTVTGFGG